MRAAPCAAPPILGMILLFLCMTAGHVAAEVTRQVPAGQAQVMMSYAPLVEKTAPAVVNIHARKITRRREGGGPPFNDPFFRRFFGDFFDRLGRSRTRVENSLGSGVIVAPDGLVITNSHVIAGAKDIRVALSDKREFAADLLLADPRSDLAVLRLRDAGENLPSANLGRVDDLAVGDLVLAIGNPFGVGQTVTGGIVSGLARGAVGITGAGTFIQTDAAINPGNSGGALLAMDGRVVGINTAIYSRSGGSHGIGFAIPADMVPALIRAARDGGPARRPWSGFVGRDIDPDMAEALDLIYPRGVIVESVHPLGAAVAAGVRRGDLILAVAGREIENANDLQFRLLTREIGAQVSLELLRDGVARQIDLPLVAAPETPPRDPFRVSGDSLLAGAGFINLSPAVAEVMGLAMDREGVMLFELARRSPAMRAGLRQGDMLHGVNGTTISLTADLRRLLGRRTPVRRIEVSRDGKRYILEAR